MPVIPNSYTSPLELTQGLPKFGSDASVNFQILGGLRVTPSTTYSIDVYDGDVRGNTTSAAFTATLHGWASSPKGKLISITNTGTANPAKGLTIAPASGEKLFGVVDYTITIYNLETLTVRNNGVDGWELVSLGRFVNPPYVYNDNTADATAGTSIETLKTVSLPAGFLGIADEGLLIEAEGFTAANGNNKTLDITFGATTIATTGAVALNAGYIRLRAILWRTGAATQKARGEAMWSTSQSITGSTPAETLANSIAVAVKGTTPTASGDLTCDRMTITKLQAGGLIA